MTHPARLCLSLLAFLPLPALAADADMDTLPDEWEVANGRDPATPDYAINTTCTKDENGGSCTPAISLAPYSYFVSSRTCYGMNEPGSTYYVYTPSLAGVVISTQVNKCFGGIYSQTVNGQVPAESLVQFYGIGQSFCFLDNDGKHCHFFNGSVVTPQATSMFIDSDRDGVQRPGDVDDLNALSDSDGDSVLDYIDADPLSATVNSEKILPVDSGYKGSAVGERATVQ